MANNLQGLVLLLEARKAGMSLADYAELKRLRWEQRKAAAIREGIAQRQRDRQEAEQLKEIMELRTQITFEKLQELKRRRGACK